MDTAYEANEGIDSATKIWGNLLTSDQLKSLGIAPDPLSSNKRQKKDQQKRKEHAKPGSSSSTTTVPTELLSTLTRLVMRHEDSLNTLLQESEFMVFMAPGPGSILPTLMQTSKTWHAQEKQEPLRHLLAKTMLQVLELRLDKLLAAAPTEELFQDCVTYHLISQDQAKTMPYLRWNPKAQKLQPTDAPGLPAQQVKQSLTNLIRLMSDHRVTLRFHALRKPQEGLEVTQAIPWLWTVSLRHNTELYYELDKLAHHSIWQLIQVRLRAQSLTRSPLAQQLLKVQ